MACEDDPDCRETLQHLDEFIDAEMSPELFAQLQHHLETCPPCLEQYSEYQDLRWRIASSCGCRTAPNELRERIMTSITEVRVTAGFTTLTVRRTEIRAD